MTKADKLRELFPNYVGSPGIEVFEDDDSLKVVTYLNIPENRIEIMWTNWDEGAGEWHNGDIEGATLDDTSDGVNEFDDTEFKLLVQGLSKKTMKEIMKKSQLRQIIREEIKNNLKEDKGAMYQLIKLRDIENPYNLHRDLMSSLNRFARATVAKEQGYQGFGLDNELQLTRLDVNNQAAFHKLDREEVKDTLKRALELYRSTLEEQDVITKMTEIKGFEEFKETGFKLGDKVKFMGSAHPTHIKPIKLTGTIEYFEPADEIGIRVDGYGAFIPFFEIQSNIELIN